MINNLKWLIWFVMLIWCIQVFYTHYIVIEYDNAARYTSIADHILKNRRSDAFAAHAKRFMQDGMISNDEFDKLTFIAHHENGFFEFEHQTDLTLEQAKQLLSDVL